MRRGPKGDGHKRSMGPGTLPSGARSLCLSVAVGGNGQLASQEASQAQEVLFLPSPLGGRPPGPANPDGLQLPSAPASIASG